ncbi:unnamed protein product [Tuber aestivum]|uniref:Uncharacterized protein n=1 Tax=Tuber aestivum TaxID=59557 RepID=A0A292Q052_9PEZI|nr:unnamed protein product [Tuber aestivum]
MIAAYASTFDQLFDPSPTSPYTFSSDMSSPTTRATRAVAEKVFHAICDAIKSGKPEVLEFANLDSAVSDLVLDSLFDRINGHLEEHSFHVHFSALDHHLLVVMPSLLHEAAGAWLIEQYTRWRGANLISSEASRAIMKPVSPRIDNFIGQYANTVKEPDFSFIPVGPNRVKRDFPSIVLEAGWSTTAVGLTEARRIWHDGSGGRVMVVILVKLFRPRGANDPIRVTLEISHTTPGGAYHLLILRSPCFQIPVLHNKIQLLQSWSYSGDNVHQTITLRQYFRLNLRSCARI